MRKRLEPLVHLPRLAHSLASRFSPRFSFRIEVGFCHSCKITRRGGSVNLKLCSECKKVA